MKRFLGLNAPFGARCFLTVGGQSSRRPRRVARLNAPFGARCFLTHPHRTRRHERRVLMHLLALGAF